MAARVSVTGGAQVEFPLTFNQIKNVPGAYEMKGTGDILVVYSKKSTFVADKNVSTGYSRTGHALFDKSKNRLRKTVNDKSPDGVAQWRKFTGKLTLDFAA